MKQIKGFISTLLLSSLLLACKEAGNKLPNLEGVSNQIMTKNRMMVHLMQSLRDETNVPKTYWIFDRYGKKYVVSHRQLIDIYPGDVTFNTWPNKDENQENYIFKFDLGARNKYIVFKYHIGGNIAEVISSTDYKGGPDPRTGPLVYPKIHYGIGSAQSDEWFSEEIERYYGDLEN